MQMLNWLTDALWSPWLLGLFLLTGLYLSVRTGFFQLFGLWTWLRATAGSILRPAGGRTGKGISQWEALCTALASTIGTGSIAGVATAIWYGGPGAVFWMWVSAFLGMMTSFVEKSLAVRYRQKKKTGEWVGGPMYYLSNGVGSPVLGWWYGAVCLCAAFIGGNLVQSNSIAASLHAAFGWEKGIVGVVTMAAVGLVMLGGIGRIARVSTWLVPVMAGLYVGGGILVLVLCREQLPRVLAQILTCAFCPAAVFGGGIGYTVTSAMRYGIARGVFTNEAGLGTSAIAHAAADVDRPVRQGMWGMLEVGVSTLVVCSITALAILVSGVYTLTPFGGFVPGGVEVGAPLTAAAFSGVLGQSGGVVVALSLLLFAFSSILGWSYYGQQCLAFCVGQGRGQRMYRGVFLLCVLLGSVWNSEQVWVLVDFFNALMALPNLAAIVLLSPGALLELKRWKSEKKK